MKTTLMGLLTVCCMAAHAQDFSRVNIKMLDENMSSIQTSWISMNADTLLDFALTGVSNDQFKIVVYDNQLVKKNTIVTGMKTGFVQVADWDRDNKMDILVSGKTAINTDALFLFKNNGDFTFTKVADKLLDYSGSFRVADMNNDAVPDLVTFGPSFIRVFRNSNNTLTKAFERNDITPTDVSIFDMTNDGMNDIVATSATLTTYVNNSNFRFRIRKASSSINGRLSLADWDGDSFFDVVVADQVNTRIWKNNGDTLIVSTTMTKGTLSGLFTGDLNSNGIPDIVLDSIGLISMAYGDQNRDGKPDVMHVKDSIGSQWLKLYHNVTPVENERPKSPGASFAISTFDRTFIFWEPATDDHTAQQSITYDVWLGINQSNIIAPSFSLSNARRMIVAHGNAGTTNALIVKGLTDNRYFYGVQSVDNAYNGSYSTSGSNVVPCFDLSHNDVQACKGAPVVLTTPQEATWFSTSTGFLEKTDALQFTANAADTLFAFVPQGMDCSKNRVYVIHVHDSPPVEQQTVYACKDKEITLTIDPGWKNPVWSMGPTFTVTGPVNVQVKAKGEGCDYQKDISVKISEPVVSINGDGFQVMSGNQVQLQAMGNVQSWQWTPPDGLSDAAISNPMASPMVSTEYTVTGTDSVGCTATAKTNVLVQQSAFVPNLFTPNNDGKNDTLMIYGLSATSGFTFRIYNREGSTVYETKDLAEATTVGWNGTVRGKQQPSGLYYWKVDGKLPDGSKLLLNGKLTGSILLIHNKE